MNGVAWQDALVATLRATPGACGGEAGVPAWSRIGGNALSSVWSLAIGASRCFVKVADNANGDVLAAEVDALRAIAQTHSVRVPQVVAGGQAQGVAFLVLEWLNIVEGGRDAALGRALALLHAHTAPRFGWHRDNTIGTTPQRNDWHDEWAAFFRDMRLAPQFELAGRNGHGGRLAKAGERLLAKVDALLRDHAPAASLLHGDLWAGNAGRLADGTPVVFDPSTYHGDREADLAMTELFGGFAPEFYAAYAEAAPLPPGHETRRTLYNLYHVLNHLNLFGAAYLERAEGMTAELTAVAG
ncbi:MAG: fructosamine kinase family protein [Betaproteobacteria bacterium]|nr:fructosamine kinase family protein [Betaproteobacteria bacterium]